MLRAGDGHGAFFKRLAQLFQNVARKFRQFVQEQHPVMRQTYFARPGRPRSSADQSRV